MAGLRVAEKADLNVYYEAECLQFAANYPGQTMVSREVFVSHYEKFPSIGFEMDGIQFGGVIFDGKEAHIAILPAHHGRWALLMREGLKWLFSLQDPIDVRVRKTNEKCLRFLDRNKWPRVSEEGEDIVFRMSNHPDLFIHRRPGRLMEAA